ncbi:UNVERIFIED_CONTAM: hypothetical protein PYX00_001899 [Menopon gallinae]|uniref:Death-associated protein 1 n=1 Tax=Menopon gallinae TaxID=328185 RepID=A0AAW2IEM5_9NEOP
MRVPQHRHNSESEKSKEMEPTEGNAAFPPTSVATNISGAIARGNADFPTEAVQNYHEKPMPTHDVRAAVNKPNIIHQPRK